MTHRPNAITHTQEYTVLPEVVRHTFIIFRLFTTPNLCPLTQNPGDATVVWWLCNHPPDVGAPVSASALAFFSAPTFGPALSGPAISVARQLYALGGIFSQIWSFTLDIWALSIIWRLHGEPYNKIRSAWLRHLCNLSSPLHERKYT